MADDDNLNDVVKLIKSSRQLLQGIPSAEDLDSLLSVALSEAKRLARHVSISRPDHVPFIKSGTPTAGVDPQDGLAQPQPRTPLDHSPETIQPVVPADEQKLGSDLAQDNNGPSGNLL